MILTGNLGFPRIGANRELKFALEKYWKGNITADDLQQTASEIQSSNWKLQRKIGLDIIPSNDFSFYDHVLDTTILLSAIPERFEQPRDRSPLDLYFSLARGYQTSRGQAVPALEMTKWFNTNYHFLVPEIDAHTQFRLNPAKPLETCQFARSLGITTRPVILGPVTYLLLAKSSQPGFSPLSRLPEVIDLYDQLFALLSDQTVDWVQLDEPALSTDLSPEGLAAYRQLFEHYSRIEKRPKVMLTAYFGDLSENAALLAQSPFEGLHVDLLDCRRPERLFSSLNPDKVLSLGLIDGRNIWKNDLDKSLKFLRDVHDTYHFQDLVIAPSCSMLHVPQDLEMEKDLPESVSSRLAFAKQKLQELVDLKAAADDNFTLPAQLHAAQPAQKNDPHASSSASEQYPLHRKSLFEKRKAIQQKTLQLPLLPTTTIGSFPQTNEIRRLRSQLQKGEITAAEYRSRLKQEIEKTIRFQEEIGLDVLVHGEFERNDMVQYFAEQLNGFAFTENGWVQSFGSRCVRPPIIYGDVSRPAPMTVAWATYSQSLTKKPVKGMLTGPVTILQWSFVRADQPRAQTCRQIAAAIRAEVLDLEQAGIRIIQIDEPALREGLPIQRKDWAEYLDWAVECFQIASASVGDETQIHTHMCYAEFNDIIEAIAKMDADVISIEASRSKMELLDAFDKFNYPNDIGPGVYDIHSPNIPETDEIVYLIHNALKVISARQLWINPDCGLKTRQWDEVTPSLDHMLEAVREVRAELQEQ